MVSISKTGDMKREMPQTMSCGPFLRAFFSKSRNDSSYKYGFLKAIIDNLYNVDKDLKLTFDELFSKFGEIYVCKQNIQGLSRSGHSDTRIGHSDTRSGHSKFESGL